MTVQQQNKGSLIKTIECGYLRKAHGHRGEAVIALSSDLYADMHPEFLFITIEGIPIPFKVSEIGGTYPNLIVKMTRLNSDTEVEAYRSATISISYEEYEKLLDQQVNDIDDHHLIGCQIHHASDRVIGKLIGIDDTTSNHLMIIKNHDGQEIMIPLVEEWIHDIDMQQRLIILDCPLELLDL